MSKRLNDVVVHVDESLGEAELAGIEQGIRAQQGVVSVGHRPGQAHLLMVVYDAAVTPAAGLLHHFRQRGLHAELIGL
jgi:hypothetical protein